MVDVLDVVEDVLEAWWTKEIDTTSEPVCSVGDHPAHWVLHMRCCGAEELYCTEHKKQVIKNNTGFFIIAVVCKSCSSQFRKLEDVVQWRIL